jgi:hypothetical protein
MANWHGYILITVPPGFTATNQRAAYDALATLGPPWMSREELRYTPIVREYDEEGNLISETGGDPYMETVYFHHTQPAIMYHSRVSISGGQIIMEAEFDEAEITRDAVVDLVAAAVGLPRPPIDATMKYQIFAEGESWDVSRLACVAYLKANISDWETEE